MELPLLCLLLRFGSAPRNQEFGERPTANTQISYPTNYLSDASLSMREIHLETAIVSETKEGDLSPGVGTLYFISTRCILLVDLKET